MNDALDGHELDLHLCGHCVCNTAKHAVLNATRTLLEEDPDEAETERLSDDLDLLQCFLQETDFSALRVKDPRLDGREDLHVRLRYDGTTGEIHFSILENHKGDSEP